MEVKDENENIKDELPTKSLFERSFIVGSPPTYREILKRILKDDDSEDGIEWLASSGCISVVFVDGVFKKRTEELRPGDLDKHCKTASAILYKTIDGKITGKLGM